MPRGFSAAGDGLGRSGLSILRGSSILGIGLG
jgi:hypothetical protein